MTAAELLTYLTHALFLAVSIRVALDAYRSPTRSNINILLFFGAFSLVIGQSWIRRAVGDFDSAIFSLLSVMITMSIPYLLLRLARDFASAPALAMRLAEAGLAISFIVIATIGVDATPLVPVGLASYFAVVSIYAASRFHAASTGANGITKRRLRAITWASVLLGAAILGAGVRALFDGAVESAISVVVNLVTVACATLYLIGFAPPTFMRRLWQEPELMRFLNHTVRLPRVASIGAMIDQIETGAAEILGAPNASIGLYDADTGQIDYFHRGRQTMSAPPNELIGGHSFTQQRPLLSRDSARDDPANREIYQHNEARAVMAAPITADEHRIGVLSVFAATPPIFAEDDLDLVTLIADQAAILLENRMYFEHAAELRAKEEAVRLRDDFLSSAAHDLKTPLTTIVAAGQYLERRLKRAEDDSPELTTVQRLNRESRRLQTLVQELLDASRVEQGHLIIQVEQGDLVSIVREVGELRAETSPHTITIDTPDELIGEFDSVRIQQLVENLVENGIKYSPDGGEVTVRAWKEDDRIRLSVSDQGIGISPSDQSAIFERFHRGKNVDDRVFSGMGLGLYICKGIVEQHGGKIWVESELGRGSTFHVVLPAGAPASGGGDTSDDESEADPASRRRSQHSSDVAGDSVTGRVSSGDGPGWARGATSN